MSWDSTKPGVSIDDRYILKDRLGGGGVATVWEVYDVETRQVKALKLLHPQFRASEDMQVRLAREAQLLASLEHPNIVTAYLGEHGLEQHYFVMELLKGKNLQDELGDRAGLSQYFSARELTTIFEPICEAVQYAHELGVVHRDLKPSNIMLAQVGAEQQVKVFDFGMAKLLDYSGVPLTKQGLALGTLLYMPLEQAEGQAIDERCDVFALGCILFEMLTLKRAWLQNDRGEPLPAFVDQAIPEYPQNTLKELLRRMMDPERPLARPLRPTLPPSVDALLSRAMALRAKDRFESVSALLSAFRAIFSDDPFAEPMASTVAAPVPYVPDALAEVVLPDDTSPVALGANSLQKTEACEAPSAPAPAVGMGAAPIPRGFDDSGDEEEEQTAVEALEPDPLEPLEPEPSFSDKTVRLEEGSGALRASLPQVRAVPVEQPVSPQGVPAVEPRARIEFTGAAPAVSKEGLWFRWAMVVGLLLNAVILMLLLFSD